MKRNAILMLCLAALITGCSESPNQKAARLLQKEIGITAGIQLDSIHDYPGAFSKRIEAIGFKKMAKEEAEKFISYSKSLSESERDNEDFRNYHAKAKEDVTSWINKAKDSDIKAAGIELRGSMEGIPIEFVGWSYTHKNDTVNIVYYLNKDISEILAVKTTEID